MALDRANHDEPVQAQERFLFQGQSASGYARQHVGNVYNNYAYNYTIRKRRSDETLQEDQRNKQLLKAAAAGHTSRAKYLVNLGTDRDYSDDEQGFTALHHSALSGFEDTVKLLLDEGWDPDAQCLDHGTPLHLAAFKGRLNVLNLLLSLRADPNATSERMGRPLHSACAGTRPEIVNALLCTGARVSETALIDFRLVHSKLNITPREYTLEVDAWECQPLFVATCFKCPDAVKLLLNARAPANHGARKLPRILTPVGEGEKPLPTEPPMHEQQASTSLVVAVDLALPYIVWLHFQGEQAATLRSDNEALFAAARGGRDECLKILLGQKMPLDVRHDSTPLIEAANGGHIKAARLLIAVGADVNQEVSSKHCSTALHMAVMSGRLKMIEVLLSQGANRSLVNPAGCTAIDLARELEDFHISHQSRYQMIRMLESDVAPVRTTT